MRLLVLCLLASFVLTSRCSSAEKELALMDVFNLGFWSGLTPDTDLTYKGEPTAAWVHARSPKAQTDRMPYDWSSYNCLRFALHSKEATHAKFNIIISSETDDTEGGDYFSFAIPIDWTGWREFVIPFNEMGSARKPVGWSKIDSIMFTAEGWGNNPHPNSVIHIANLRLSRLIGPGISDSEFFDILNPDYPGLEKVKSAVDSGDLSAAKHEFAEYLRHREKPVWNFDWKARPRHDSRPEGVDTTEADRILEHDLPSVSVYHKFDGEIDWNLNPIDYREWPWQLNRHPFWVTLGRAYWATGDEKYAREFVYQMTDWVKRCSVPRYTSGNSTYTWRTIEAGIRTAGSWMESYHLFLTSPSFDDDSLIMMVKSFVEHARHLMRWPTSGNWLAMECNGLMHIGVVFPEFKEAAEWRNTASERLYRELDRQVYPDGAQIELTTGYHQVSLGNFIKAWEIAHLNGVPMPRDYIAKIQKMFDYDLDASMPDGTLPGLNDGNRTNIKRWLGQGFNFFPDRKDYEWVATQGKKGEEPKVRSIALPFSGQLIMRSGWKKDDLYMLMDFGPFGYGHQHEDALSFVIYARGKYQLVDPGNYAYDGSKWRKYVLSTRAHNTILVDGLDQHRAGRPREQYVVSKPPPNRWASCEQFDYASGSYTDGYGPDNKVKVTHTRSVFFVKPDYWIVTDLLKPSDNTVHRYDSMFHIDAETAKVQERSKAVTATSEDSPGLVIFPAADESLKVSIASGQEEPVVQGWVPAAAYKCRPIPTPIFEKQAEGRTSFVYVFYPTDKGAACPIMRVERVPVGSERNAAAVAVNFEDGRVDYFVQSDIPGAKLEFLDFETDAAAAYIRTEGGKLTRAYTAGGSGLSMSGNSVPVAAQSVQDLSKTDVTHKF